MITVIATGFDGKQRRHELRREQAQAPTDASAAFRAPRDRDFLEELERQRTETANGNGAHDEANRRDDSAAATVGVPRVERSVAEPVPVKRPAYDADDLEIPSFLRRK
jgi:hypothetical protein